MKVYYNRSCDEFNGEDCYLVCSFESRNILINIPNDTFKLLDKNDSMDNGDYEIFDENYLDAYAKSKGFEPVVKIWRLEDTNSYKVFWYDIEYQENSDYLKTRLNQMRNTISKKARQSFIDNNSYSKFIHIINSLISNIK